MLPMLHFHRLNRETMHEDKICHSHSTQSACKILCTYEDRESDVVGLKLLLLSLAEACPDLRVVTFAPDKMHHRILSRTLASNVLIRDCSGIRARGWSVKPELLLTLLDEGHEEVIWMDSDVLVTRDFRHCLRGLPQETLVVTEEPVWTTQMRACDKAAAWGFKTARMFHRGVNSCVIRATRFHREVLTQWKNLLTSADYLDAQAKPFADRALHLASDQDVLQALLTSERFSSVKVHFLHSGEDIAQCHLADGYSVRERLANLWHRIPPMIHSQGSKPWRPLKTRRLHEDVSPYLLVAKHYRALLEEDASWMDASSLAGKVLRCVTREGPNLAGLIPAMTMQIQRRLRLRTRLRSWFAVANHSASSGA
jgi:hypothetical protein